MASNKKSTFTQDHVHNVAVRPSLQRQVHDYLQCFYVLEIDFFERAQFTCLLDLKPCQNEVWTMTH